jgi:4-hydroxybutyrate CoA-transferase
LREVEIIHMHTEGTANYRKTYYCITLTTSKGETKIVPYLKKGAGVVSTRANVHFIVTEYGIGDLYGKSLNERAKLLTSIAHPSHRENLEKEFCERYK